MNLVNQRNCFFFKIFPFYTKCFSLLHQIFFFHITLFPRLHYNKSTSNNHRTKGGFYTEFAGRSQPHSANTSTWCQNTQELFWKMHHQKRQNNCKCCLFISREHVFISFVLVTAKYTHEAQNSNMRLDEMTNNIFLLLRFFSPSWKGWCCDIYEHPKTCEL